MRVVKSIIRFFRPLQRRLPLMMAGLLCVVVATFGLLVERELKSAFETAATQRLSIAAQRLASMLYGSAGAMRKEITGLAADTSVVAALEHRSNDTRLSAITRLERKRPDNGQPLTRSLWTADCQLLLIVGPLQHSSIAQVCPGAASTADASPPGVGLLAQRGDSVFITAKAPVLGPARDTIGFIVDVRVSSGGARAAIAGLIGKGASAMFGNASGPDVWTNLAKSVEGPPRPIERGVPMIYTPASGTRQIGIGMSIATTPWLVWVQMPLANAVAGEYQTLRNLSFIALACIIIGVTGAWMLSSYLTRPLVELTRATKDIANGNYSRRVDTLSDEDELGALMSSFNGMAEKVEVSNRELSTLAQELENRYHEAQTLAEELEMSNRELNKAAEATRTAHQQMEVAQLLLDEVMTQAPVGIAVFDDHLRFVRVNAALATMDGVPMEQHVGNRPSGVMPAGCIEEAELASVLASGQIVAGQRSTCALEGGAKRNWLTSYFPVRGTDGDVTGAGVIVLDTTAHSELEAQLLQAQKMEAVGRLAGGVAHDFNNLLTVISSYSQMALETLRPGEPLYADMHEIRSSADRASRLTRQLLAFSRKQVMQPQKLDLNHVAAEMEKMLHRLIGENVVLVFELAVDLGEVTADPGQIEQVLMNLVLNARDAMPEGGRLVVATSNVSVSVEGAREDSSLRAGDYVTLRVSDTGTGMSEETKTHLFEPFYTTKDTGQGTGLGLSTVYGIVKQSGGEIRVHSESGRGSAFTVYLPRLETRKERIERGGAVPEMPFAGSETILLVEDNAALRNLALRILRGAGYHVLEARSANAAIELGKSYSDDIHLLLTDVVMPQISGRVVAEGLQTLRPGMRVLFMSGYADDIAINHSVQSAHSDFLLKPFTPDQLMQRIREVLDGRGPTVRRRLADEVSRLSMS
ncbi:MAG: ATP-binding protein [bacterium]